MNRIKQLTAINLKGGSFSYPLETVNVICGSNFTGKTAVLSAVRLALLGMEPDLPNTNKGIFMACGGVGGATQMVVSAILTDGQVLEREWLLKKGTVTYNGPSATEFIKPMLLDPTAYFNLTGPAQLNYVLSQCDMSALGLGFDALMAKLAAGINPDTESGRAQLDEIKTHLAGLEVERQREDCSVYDWLVSAVDWLKEQAKAAGTLADNAEATIKGLVAAAAVEGDMSAAQSVQPKITEARLRHAEAISAKAVADGALQAAKKALADTKAKAGTKVDSGEAREQIKMLRTTIEAASLVPDAGEMPPGVATASLQDETAVRLQHSKAENALTRALAYREQCEKAVESLKAELDKVDAQTCCPACGQTISEDNKDKAKLVIKARVDAAVTQLKAAGATFAVAVDDEHKAAEALKAVLDSNAALRSEVEKVTAKYRVDMDAWRAGSRAYADAQSQMAEATRRIAVLEKAIADSGEAEQAAGLVPGLEKVMVECNHRQIDAVGVVNTIVAEINELELAQRKFIARAAENKRMEQCRRDAEESNAKRDVCKAALKLVAEEKDRASVDAFKYLLTKARLFTDGILKAPLEYREGELGMTWQGNWVSYRVFSGTEKLLAFAGLSVALTQHEQMVTRVVLMDELGRMDAGNKIKLAKRMKQLTAEGIIDQFIGVDVTDHIWVSAKDINVITVASTEAAA